MSASRLVPVLSAVIAQSALCALLPAAAFANDPLDPDAFEDLTEAVGVNDDDVVETIGADNPSDEIDQPSLAQAAPSPAEPANSFRASGYARQSLELVYGELARQSLGPGASPLWRDIFASRSQLVVRASYVEGRSFEATVSGLLGYTLHVAEQAPEYTITRIDLSRGEIDSDLREAYLGFFWPAFDLRIGQQRIAWGRSDFQSPNDVINARDLRDPFLAETELTHLPTLALRSSVSAGPVTFEVVVSPFFVPDRSDVYGSNWAAIQRRAPTEYQRFVGTASILVDQSVERDMARLWRHTQRPQDNGKGASAGARLTANLSGLDVSAYYHYGYDSTPFIRLDPAFQAYLYDPNTNLTPEAPRTELTPVLEMLDRGIQPISSRYVRRHHIGLDAATAVGPLIIRVDGAYQTRRIFYHLDLNSFTTPAALGVLGLEYQTGDLDKVALIELLGARLMNTLPAPLLGYRRTTAALAGTIRWALSESWGVDIRGLVGLRPKSHALQPALRYKASDAFSLRLGVLVMGGSARSFGWYFGDNDTAFVQLRYAF